MYQITNFYFLSISDKYVLKFERHKVKNRCERAHRSRRQRGKIFFECEPCCQHNVGNWTIFFAPPPANLAFVNRIDDLMFNIYLSGKGDDEAECVKRAFGSLENNALVGTSTNRYNYAVTTGELIVDSPTKNPRHLVKFFVQLS